MHNDSPEGPNGSTVSYSTAVKLPFFVIVVVLISACGNDFRDTPSDGGASPYQGPPTYPISAVPETVDARNQYTLAFPILNTQSTAEQRPVEPGGTSPFGVMILFQGETNVGLCSATHISTGRVVLNAHCIEEDANASHYFLAYYDRTGTKRSAQATGIISQGSSTTLDVAVLSIDAINAARWEISGSSTVDTSGNINAAYGSGNTPVTLWTFDPVTYNGGRAMAFHPKQCTSFRREPELFGSKNGTLTRISTSSINASYNLFIDQCDSETMPGNSGSLVTARDTVSQPLGVYKGRRVSSPTEYTAYTSIQYTGSTGIKQFFTPAVDLVYFRVGIAFDAVLKYNPGIF